MKAKDLANINKSVKELLNEYMSKKGLTPTQFAYKTGVQPNQIMLYLMTDEKKGLHSYTLEKIGLYMIKNP